MDGTKLRERLITEGYPIAEIASKMGSYEQKLNSKFQARDLGINFLLELAKATNKNLWELVQWGTDTTDIENIEGLLMEESTPYMNSDKRLIETQELLIKLHQDYAQALKQTLELTNENYDLKKKLEELNETLGRLNRRV